MTGAELATVVASGLGAFAGAWLRTWWDGRRRFVTRAEYREIGCRYHQALPAMPAGSQEETT